MSLRGNICTSIVGGMLWAAGALTNAKAADIVGVGAMSCEAWAEQNELDQSFALAKSAWLAGYLSSYSVHRADIYMQDAEVRDKWVTDYCLKYMTDNVWTAANRLVDELNRLASVVQPSYSQKPPGGEPGGSTIHPNSHHQAY